MELVFIRHLQTPGNEKRQYIGITDEELSARAEERLRAGGIRYPSVQHVIASPMKRCIQTARLIYPGQEIRTEPLLRECDFGRFEGKSYEELKHEPDYIRWLETGGMTPFPEGESREHFRERCGEGVKKWIGRLILEGAESTAFVVHGGTIMAAFSQLAEEPHDFYDWQVKNGRGYAAAVWEKDWSRGRIILRDVQDL